MKLNEPIDASCTILCGGSNSGMKQDKAWLIVNGDPVIKRMINQLSDIFSEIIISANDSEKFSQLNYRIVKDEFENCGPVTGIYCALKISKHQINFITACDIPDMNRELIIILLRKADIFDAVVPRHPNSMIEPLYAVYNKKGINKIIDNAADNKYKIHKALKHMDTLYLNILENDWYHNLNTMEDYQNHINRSK